MTEVGILIAGAGPAGASLAGHLASRHSGDVHLCDARTFPRPKLCGEFLSPEVMAYLETLGAADGEVLETAPRISEAVLVTPSGSSVFSRLSRPALGVSRDVFDQYLTMRARSRGVGWRPGTRVLGIEVEPGGRHRVALVTDGRPHTITARVVVNATGSTLGTTGSSGPRRVRSPASPPGRRVPTRVAFKRHYRSRGELPADIEGRITMFIVPGGYLGISPVGPGTANVCFLCRTTDLRTAGRRGEGVLSRIADQHPRLAGWLGELEPEGPFLSTSDIRFGLRPTTGPALPVGDAMGVVPPLVGDGIAMAMRSAELAAPLLSRHLSDELTWDRVRADYAGAWRREFGRRMRVARVVHEIAARPAGARVVAAAMRRAPGLLDWLVRSTRDWGRATGERTGAGDVLASGRR